MFTALRSEFVYVWYYFDIQFRQIFVYWVLGMLIGSLVSVFAKDKIHKLFASMQGMRLGMAGVLQQVRWESFHRCVCTEQYQ